MTVNVPPLKNPFVADSDVQDPVTVAAALRPLLATHADACERERRIVDTVMAALRSSGLFYITAPQRAGGLGGKLITHIETVAELAKRSEEHTSELQSLMRISYAVFCLKKKTIDHQN